MAFGESLKSMGRKVLKNFLKLDVYYGVVVFSQTPPNSTGSGNAGSRIFRLLSAISNLSTWLTKETSENIGFVGEVTVN